MLSILDFGLSVIHWVQTARTVALDHFFERVSLVGSEYFYFAALPIIVTLLNRKIGLRIALTVSASVMINSIIKAIVHEPRPFTFDPSVAVLVDSGFAFPSGHTQSATVFFGLAILYIRQWWMILLGALFVGLVGLSRLYLGAHYPTDILGSLVVGSIIVFAHTKLAVPLENLWRPSTKRPLVVGAFIVAVLCSIFVAGKDMVSSAALASGLIAGLVFTDIVPPLALKWRERMIGAIITGAVLLVVYAGLKMLLPARGENHYELFSFVRYFFCGFTLSGLPLFLQRPVKPHAQ